MSRSVRAPDYRVITMYQCFECATCTPHPPNANGVSLCDKHREKS